MEIRPESKQATIKFRNKWTKDEDKLLLKMAEKSKLKNKWKHISMHITNKSPKQCFSRYNQITPQFKAGKWSSEEDHRLLNLVNVYNKNWAQISKDFIDRSPKQIRDRYLNFLSPELKKIDFSKQEDNEIINLVNQLGKKWVLISKRIQGRSSYSIKNRYNTLSARIKQENPRSNTIMTTSATLSVSTLQIFKIIKAARENSESNTTTIVNVNLQSAQPNYYITDQLPDLMVLGNRNGSSFMDDL